MPAGGKPLFTNSSLPTTTPPPLPVNQNLMSGSRVPASLIHAASAHHSLHAPHLPATSRAHPLPHLLHLSSLTAGVGTLCKGQIINI